MKVVILCGGLGTRLREETEFRPKPMVEVDLVAHHEDLRPPWFPRVRPVPGLSRQQHQRILPRLRGHEQRFHHAPRREIAYAGRHPPQTERSAPSRYANMDRKAAESTALAGAKRTTSAIKPTPRHTHTALF